MNKKSKTRWGVIGTGLLVVTSVLAFIVDFDAVIQIGKRWNKPDFLRDPRVEEVSPTILSSPDVRVVKVTGFQPQGESDVIEKYVVLYPARFLNPPRISLLWRKLSNLSAMSEMTLYRFSSSVELGAFDIDDEKGSIIVSYRDSSPSAGRARENLLLIDFPKKFAAEFDVKCATSLNRGKIEAGEDDFSGSISSIQLKRDTLSTAITTPCWWFSVGNSLVDLPVTSTMSVMTATRELVPFKSLEERIALERRLHEQQVEFVYARHELSSVTIFRYTAQTRSISTITRIVSLSNPGAVSEIIAEAQSGSYVAVQSIIKRPRITDTFLPLTVCLNYIEAARNSARPENQYCLGVDPRPVAGTIAVIRRSTESVRFAQSKLSDVAERVNALLAQGYQQSTSASATKCDKCFAFVNTSSSIIATFRVGRSYQLEMPTAVARESVIAP